MVTNSLVLAEVYPELVVLTALPPAEYLAELFTPDEIAAIMDDEQAHADHRDDTESRYAVLNGTG